MGQPQFLAFERIRQKNKLDKVYYSSPHFEIYFCHYQFRFSRNCFSATDQYSDSVCQVNMIQFASNLLMKWLNYSVREAVKKKIAEKETLVHTGGRGVKNPFFLAHQKGDIFLWGEGSKSFCLMSHVHFCASVSTQFEAFLEALHYGNFLYLLIK